MRFTIKPQIVVPDHEEIQCAPKLVWELWVDDITGDLERHENAGQYPTKEHAESAARLINEYDKIEEYVYECN